MKYAKVNIKTGEVLELVDEVPETILGLSQNTLDNLSVIKDQVPEFDGIGFWLIDHVYNQGKSTTTVDSSKKSVIVTHTKPDINVYYQPMPIRFPEIGEEEIPEQDDAPRPITNISCVGNIYMRMIYFKNAGDVMPGHSHAYDHPTLLAKGSVEVNYQGIKTKFSAPTVIYIKAETSHEITALEDETLAYCIHPLRNNDVEGDIIDPSCIPDGVFPLLVAKPLG